MTKTSQTIVFFGSGPVAAKSLELLAQNFEIEAVITKPKPDHHRGEFPVVALAEKLGLKTLYASNKKELSELFATKPVTSTIGVLIDFGIIVTQDVIDYFPLGIVNSHFSLLPEWRGADPITFSILSGQVRTGVSLMLIDQGMDTGLLLAQADYDIPSDATTPSLTEALIELSDKSLAHVLPLWMDGQTQAAKQEDITIADTKSPTYSRKLTKDDGLLDWNKPAEQLEREIRGFIDWPKSRTQLGGMDIVITKAAVVDAHGTPGEVRVEDKNLLVCTGKKALRILELKPAGKKEMPIQAFLAGYGKNFS